MQNSYTDPSLKQNICLCLDLAVFFKLQISMILLHRLRQFVLYYAFRVLL